MGNTKTKKTNDEKFSVCWTVTIAVVICLVLWIGGMFLTRYIADYYKQHYTGEGNLYALFGDSFGAVNALISAFAFAGVIVAIVIQRNELRLQREDLKLQREEFTTQNTTLKLQRFENTFFNMLNLQQAIVANLKFQSRPNRNCPSNMEGRDLESREIFQAMFDESYIDDSPFDINKGGFIGIKEVIELYGIESGYANVKELALFDHYFRHLYRIIKFIDKSHFLNKEDKFQYVGMVRATLSRYELIFIFYNGLIFPKSKKQIETYALLQNMYDGALPHKFDNTKYNKTAFLNDEE